MPTHVTVAELDEKDSLNALPSGERLLLDELNLTRTAIPGTALRMVYELPSDGGGPDETGS